MKKIKITIVVAFLAFCCAGLLSNETGLVQTVRSFSNGPPGGFSGAPDESSCSACHGGSEPAGQFAILNAPAVYVPGRTYQLTVRHTTMDASRLRWGFQMTSLAGSNPAGTFSNLSANTQIIMDSGRSYIEHTSDGSFPNQAGGAQWTVNWTAPSTNVGQVGLYAAGIQADYSRNPNGDQTYTTSALLRPVRAVFDFDGDGKTDIGIFRPAVGEWWYLRSSDGTNRAFQFGTGTDKIAASDFTGDGKSDVAFWRPATGEWFILRSEDGSFYSFPFGGTGDTPAPADFDGDGKSDPAIFRPSSATWFILNSSGGTTIQTFGANGDLPVPADYDGDAKADLAIFRPSNGSWWLNRTQAGLIVLNFGVSTDKTVQGDYTGDGKADVAFFRPSSNEWFISRSEDFSFYSFPFGAAGDLPAPGDYDGDGKMDPTVFRPSNNTWFKLQSTSGFEAITFGVANDIPVPGAFVR